MNCVWHGLTIYSILEEPFRNTIEAKILKTHQEHITKGEISEMSALCVFLFRSAPDWYKIAKIIVTRFRDFPSTTQLGFFSYVMGYKYPLLQLRPQSKHLLFTAACRRGRWINIIENDPLASFASKRPITVMTATIITLSSIVARKPMKLRIK